MSLKKRELTPWQRRALDKIGLMPLTGLPQIAKRFGISRQRLAMIERPSLLNLSTIADLVTRFRKSPETQAMLFHPKLWPHSRIIELGPHHTTNEIAKQLEIDREKYPSLKNARFSRRQIQIILKKLHVRTAEQDSELKKRNRSRPNNALSDEQRNKLLQIAQPFINNIKVRLTKAYGSEMEQLVTDYFDNEVQHTAFDPTMGQTRMIQQWLAYLTAGRKYIILAIILKHKRSRSKEKKLIQRKRVDAKIAHSPPGTALPSLKFHTRLTQRERQVLTLLIAGNSRKTIARELDLTVRYVGSVIKSIKGKVVK